MSAEDELAAFQAEIAAVETAAVEDDDTGDGTPEELEFEDDDGTMYVWDRATRKYKPKGEDVMAPPAAAPPPTWSAADMVFQDDDDTIPSLNDAKKAADRVNDVDDEEYKLMLRKEVRALGKQIDNETKLTGLFSDERSRLNYFWLISKKELDDKQAELRNKERELQDLTEKH